MVRGFTVMELMVTLTISAVMLFTALPNMSKFYQGYKLRAGAVALSQFFAQARTEAMTRRQDLWIEFSESPSGSDAHWRLLLWTEKEPSIDDRPLLRLSNDDLVVVTSWGLIKLDGRTGRVMSNGHLSFSSRQQLASTPSTATTLRLIGHHVTGRVRLCSEGSRFYDYRPCQ
jgi:prepilin-type N-terminal cleavage/methylation domain-containing protein